MAGTRKIVNTMLEQLHHVPGLVDLRIQQPGIRLPEVLNVNVDRTKVVHYSLRDVGSSLQNLLSGSSQLKPRFWTTEIGVNYSIVAEAPQYAHSVAE